MSLAVLEDNLVERTSLTWSTVSFDGPETAFREKARFTIRTPRAIGETQRFAKDAASFGVGG